MPNDDSEPVGGTYTSAVTRRSRRRKQALIGAAGLVAVLGVGAIVAQQMNDDPDTATLSGTTVAPTPDSSGSSTVPVLPSPPAVSGGASSSAAATTAPTTAGPATSTSPAPRTTAERIAAVRSAAAKAAEEGTQASRPLPNTNGGATVDANDVTITESGSLKKDGRTLKVVSARQDLTGQRELAWVADEGEQVGDARCTQNIRLSAGATPRVRPTLLLCWRTSATKSVYTVLVDVKQPPSKQDSVTEIERIWTKLG